MNFLNKIKSSIYDKDFYQKAVAGENTHPFKYFFKLILGLAFVFAVAVAFSGARNIQSFLEKGRVGILENYPKDLEVKIEKGIATTNAIEPYFIKIPEGTKGQGDENLENILVIDTKYEFDLETYEGYKTLGLLTRNALIAKDNNGKISVIPLRDVPDYTLNYDAVNMWLTKIEPFINSLPYLVPILAFVGVFIAKMFLLVYMFFAAFLVWIIGKIKKLDISYKTSYHLALHLVTTQLILGALAFVFKLPMPGFVPTLIFVLVAWVNLNKKVPEVLVQS